MIEVVIPGDVVPKGRPRFSRRGGRSRAYTPDATANYEYLVKTHSLKVKPKEPIGDAIEVSILICKRPPKSWSNVKKEKAIAGDIKPVTKPDIDNYAKALLDAMNGIIFVDDNLICKLTIAKEYSEEPRAVVKIKEL